MQDESIERVKYAYNKVVSVGFRLFLWKVVMLLFIANDVYVILKGW